VVDLSWLVQLVSGGLNRHIYSYIVLCPIVIRSIPFCDKLSLQVLGNFECAHLSISKNICIRIYIIYIYIYIYIPIIDTCIHIHDIARSIVCRNSKDPERPAAGGAKDVKFGPLAPQC